MDDEGTDPFLPSIIVVVVDMCPVQADKAEENSVTTWRLKARKNVVLKLFCHQNLKNKYKCCIAKKKVLGLSGTNSHNQPFLFYDIFESATNSYRPRRVIDESIKYYYPPKYCLVMGCRPDSQVM